MVVVVVVGVVSLLMLLLLMMVRMLLVMLARLRGTCTGPVQPPVPGVSRSLGAAVTSRPGGNGSRRAGRSGVEGAGGDREALVLIQRVVVVVVQMVVVVVSRFGRRVSGGARPVTDGVFHKGVHVVHAEAEEVQRSRRRHGRHTGDTPETHRRHTPEAQRKELGKNIRNRKIPLKSVSRSEEEDVKSLCGTNIKHKKKKTNKKKTNKENKVLK